MQHSDFQNTIGTQIFWIILFSAPLHERTQGEVETDLEGAILGAIQTLPSVKTTQDNLRALVCKCFLRCIHTEAGNNRPLDHGY